MNTPRAPTIFPDINVTAISASLINMNSNSIIDLLDPTEGQEAATKTYVDLATIGTSGTPNTLSYYGSSGHLTSVPSSIVDGNTGATTLSELTATTVSDGAGFTATGGNVTTNVQLIRTTGNFIPRTGNSTFYSTQIFAYNGSLLFTAEV